jgi:hypothetical protein
VSRAAEALTQLSPLSVMHHGINSSILTNRDIVPPATSTSSLSNKTNLALERGVIAAASRVSVQLSCTVYPNSEYDVPPLNHLTASTASIA